jgi:hypothetical protein
MRARLIIISTNRHGKGRQAGINCCIVVRFVLARNYTNSDVFMGVYIRRTSSTEARSDKSCACELTTIGKS